jgi:hypothetical protein
MRQTFGLHWVSIMPGLWDIIPFHVFSSLASLQAKFRRLATHISAPKSFEIVGHANIFFQWKIKYLFGVETHVANIRKASNIWPFVYKIQMN